MTDWQNDRLTEWQTDRMADWQNASQTESSIGKSYVNQLPSGV